MKKLLKSRIAVLVAAISLASFSFGQEYGSGPSVKPRSQATASSQRPEQMYPNLVIMFTGNNCPYCDYMKPIMKEASLKFRDSKIKFGLINVSQATQYPGRYGFSTIPQIMYFKDGKRLEVHGSGEKTITVGDVVQKIHNHFGDAVKK